MHMPTSTSVSKINVIMASIEAQRNYFSKTIFSLTTQLHQFQKEGDQKSTEPLAKDIENRKLDLATLDKMDVSLKNYLEKNDMAELYADHQLFQDEYNHYRSCDYFTYKVFGLFKSDATNNVFTQFKAFVKEETMPYVARMMAQEAQEAAELKAYLNTHQGQEMADTINFIRFRR